MKGLARLGLLGMIMVLGACSTDFSLEAPWQDIPIVYGFISRQDTAHYIRIEKAFLEPGGDATAIAQRPDSLYYPALQVQLVNKINGKTVNLSRVDGNAEGYPRQAGPFAQSPNYLYKVHARDLNLKGGEILELVINRGDGKPPVTAQTTVLGTLDLREGTPANPINMGYDRNVTLAWSAALEAQLFDLRLLINYREADPAAGGQLVSRQLEWVLTRDMVRTSEEERQQWVIKGEQFYQFIGEALANAPNRVRVFDSISISLLAGGRELADIYQLNQINTGITSSQLTPVFSNISEGVGVLSSRATAQRTGIFLNGPSLDSLRDGRYTRQLNFQ
ncbi:MAG: DUF4249 family protein [Lewinellaceae bacterium]|nr:DUF4249 family protein [Lewinellaceae bacterium]